MADSNEISKIAHRVVINNPGNDRPEVVRTIMLLTGMDFEKAVKLTSEQSAPGVVLETEDQDAANVAQNLLTRTGAEVHVYEITVNPPVVYSGLKYAVILNNPGDRKIYAIKAIMSITGKGLKEAKDLVESAPGCDAFETDDFEAALQTAHAISAAGADSEIVDLITGEKRTVPALPHELPTNTPSGTYRVNIMDAGLQKRRLVSFLRMQASQAYSDAQKIVDSDMPSMAVDGIDKRSAFDIANSLASAGAKMEVVDTDTMQRTQINPSVPPPQPVEIPPVMAPNKTDWKVRIKKWFFDHPKP